MIFKVSDWDSLYENHETRKYKTLRWVPVPNKHDGKGYRRMVMQTNGVELFAAWNSILQIASKMPVRGVLNDVDGPLTAEDLALKTGLPIDVFQRALEFFSSEKMGWMEIVNPSESSATQPETQPDSAESPATCEETAAELNRIELNRINNTQESGKKSNRPDWWDNFQLYVQELERQWDVLLADKEWIAERQGYHPNLDIVKSCLKALNDFWGDEDGWKHKKKKKVKTINLKKTLNNALTLSCNQVRKQRNS